MAHYEIDKVMEHTTSKSGEFTLYVNNLPKELNEHGLMQIFNHYGHIKGHFYRPNASWAFITYNTYREAENAIKDLHDVLPLHLKVSFANEKASNIVQFPKRSDSEHFTELNDKDVRNVRYKNNLPLQAKGRGKLLDVLKKVEPNSELPTYTYTTDTDLLYPYPVDLYTYNPYENAEPYGNTNTLWTRGQLTITQDGKRHVSLGRGYTMYEIPCPEPEVQNHIHKVHEKRTNGLYEYGKDVLQTAIGNCKKCSRKSKFNCEKCQTFYCSKSCQVADWAQHKTECQDIPHLVPLPEHSTPVSRSNEEQTPSRNISRIQMPLRQPKKLMNALTSSKEGINTIAKDEDENNTSVAVSNNNTHDNTLKQIHTNTNGQHDAYQKNEAKEKITTPACNRISTESKQVDGDNKFKTDNKYTQSNSINQPKKPLEKNNDDENLEKHTKRLQPFGINDVKKMEEDIAFSKHTFLPKSKFTDVRVILKLDREIWIQKVEDDNDLIQLMTELQDEAEKGPKMEPIIGNMYAVQYENVWHRAVVTALNPTKVHYIDYGNDEIVETNDFREINKYKNVPRFCAKLRLSEKANKKYKNVKYEDIIAVKMISVDSNKVINIEVEGENDTSTLDVIPKNASMTDNSTTIKPNDKTPDLQKVPINDNTSSLINELKNVVNTVFVGETGILEIHAELSQNIYSITLLPHSATSDYEKLLNDLPAMCADTIEKSVHRPQIGDLICGQRLDGDWLRGYVSSLESPLKMAIIDESRMATITKTVPCTEQFSNICAFGAVCKVTDVKYKFNEGDQYEFKVIEQKTDKKPEEIEIEITKEQDKVKAIVKPWIPMPEQKGLQYAELKSGSEVCLTAFRSHNFLFARSLSTPELEHYNYIMQNVAKCAQTSPYLKELPVVGQMVIAQYLDENYYRAIVTKVQDDKVAISYIDFGNTEVVNVKKLKVLNNDLKQMRSCTAKITLKDVPRDIPMTNEVSNYLSSLVGFDIPLICTFDGIPSKDGVYLKNQDGSIINKKVSEMLKPPTKETAEKDKTCYMINDINVVSLGNVGDTVDVLVLVTIEEGYKYAICPLDYYLTNHVYDVMPKLTKAYCESSDYYIPREKELCLALYEDDWYRATCLCRSETLTTSSVFFIDFGNVESVDHKNIRLMPKDFMVPDALASICHIINAGPTDKNGRYSSEVEKKVSEILLPSACIKVKIVECDETAGIYKVELP